jgi:DNA-directed RNA polymerase subunit RPC12/RpoP
MSSDDFWFEEPGDELDDNEYPDEDDEYPDDDETTATVTCPECGAEVYEDAVQCPVCGSYVTYYRRVWTGRPIWWIVLALLGVVATIVVLAGLAFW